MERRSGEHAVLREIWEGKAWSVRPVVVVRDTPELIAMFIPAGTAWLRPRTLGDKMLRIPDQPWMMRPAVWENNVLRLSPAGEDYSVLLIWDEAWRFQFWYVNVEDRVRRSEVGYDYMDWALDAVVSPDMTEWHWKDEDELDDCVAKAIFTTDRAADIRRSGEAALERLLARKEPFGERWEDWRPPSSWGVPALPDEWA